MNSLIKLTATIGLLLFCAIGFAQTSKVKVAKPAAVKKIDYVKLKDEIRSLYRDENYKQVITKATQYLEKFPKDTAVVFQKAASHLGLNQNKVGFDLLNKFIKNPDTAAMYVSFMAFGFSGKNLLTSGIACADEAIKISPAGPYGYFVKGGIYSDDGDHEKALPLMEKMNTLYRNEEERKLMGHFYAKELAYNNQIDKALIAINDLYVKYPMENEVINSYAIIYKLNKSYDKAIEKYDELIVLHPNEIDYKVKKAGTYILWGKTTEGCNEADSIIAKDETYEFLRFRYRCPAYFATPDIIGIKTAIWAVNANGAEYDFSVTNLKGTADSDFEFDWAMTSGDGMNGHIKLTKDAMEKAIAQNNYFGESLKDATLTDKTAVWISKAVFYELTKKGSVKMDVGSGEEEFTLVSDSLQNWDNESFENKVMVNGNLKYVNTLHIKNEDGSRQLWILNDVKNPMIVKMELGWSITLKSIE